MNVSYVIFELGSFQVTKTKEIMCEYKGKMSLKFEKKKKLENIKGKKIERNNFHSFHINCLKYNFSPFNMKEKYIRNFDEIISMTMY